MTLFLLFKGLKRIDYEAEWGEALWISAVCGIGVAAITWCTLVKSGFLENYVERMVEEDQKWEEERRAVYKKFRIAQENDGNKRKITKTSVAAQSYTATPKEGISKQGGVNAHAVTVDIDDNEDDNEDDASRETLKARNNRDNNDPNNSPSSGSNDSENPQASRIGLIASKMTHGVNVDVYDDLEK